MNMMRFSLATDPGFGNEDENEDYAASGADVVVVLDGVTKWCGPDNGCHHGTVWYVEHLGGALLRRAKPSAGKSLRAALNGAIAEVVGLHADECDLRHPDTPAATVAMVRDMGDRLEYLVLSDCVALFDTGDGVRVITDDRLARLDAAARSPEATDELRADLRDAFRRFRNRLGGYWVASNDPTAGDHALCGAVPRVPGRDAAVLTDGVSCLVDRYRAMTWPETLTLLQTGGPRAVINVLRDIERSDVDRTRWPRGKVHDDATIALCSVLGERLPGPAGPRRQGSSHV